MNRAEENVVKRAAEVIIKSNVNAACWFWFNQPILPMGSEKFKNHNKFAKFRGGR
ncbi:cyclic lactone autoinducer peptide [Anaeromicropila populeti]|uniref:Cyclic lactone autoinducer peptide n=1 Tax=Anaeromicropila populeti TaxID=37658 RepID=A0A1I6LZY1_9FIRM|nr:cyclic lactone autoinducer peptide [Anaeromicropila populeti]SFS08948.1 cyclic lactone autoinducer peptide [Anaeromicropila populeti]